MAFLLDFGPGIPLGSVIKAVSALNTGGRFDVTVSLVYSPDDNRCPDWRRYRFTLAALCRFYHRRRTYDDGRELGLWLSGKCEEWAGSRRISFFINKPYVREIVKEKIVEVEKPVSAKPGKEPKVQPSRESLSGGMS